MLSIKCIVIDDEPLARELLETHIAAVPFLEHLGSFKNAILATEFLRTTPVDLVFLDIQMPMLTGVDFMKTIPDLPPVIFTTAYREYAIEGYALDVVDYLLKPITFDRFFKAVSKVKPNAIAVTAHLDNATKSLDYLFVNVNKKQIKLVLDEILYIESNKDYLKIHLKDKQLVIKEPLSQFLQKLPNHFLQVHRSYIVNQHHITAFTQQDIEIGEREIPIGGLYKERVLEFLKN